MQPVLAEASSSTLHLLGGPYVVAAGSRLSVPEGSKRLVAFVALNDRRVKRGRAGSALWPDADPSRADGNLRSAMWRLRCAGIDILHTDKGSLFLHPELRVDVEEISQWADRLSAGKPEPSDLDFRPLAVQALDLLPGWYEDWVLLERERLCQTLLRALDALAKLLLQANRCGEAIEAALAAVSADPLRESAQRALIEAHLAEGNRCEALRSYGTYEELLVRELGVSPSAELRRLCHQTACP